jgi:hypothetical protein
MCWPMLNLHVEKRKILIASFRTTKDETVKMYSRQFMMLKAGVPEGAILNTFLAEGIEDEEGKEILEKLKEIKGVLLVFMSCKFC